MNVLQYSEQAAGVWKGTDNPGQNCWNNSRFAAISRGPKKAAKEEHAMVI